MPESNLTTLLNTVLSTLPASADDLFRQKLEQLLVEGQIHNRAHWAAHMTSSFTDAAFLGHILAAMHNGNLLSPDLYPKLLDIETTLLNWFNNVFDMPFSHFTHSGSYANLEALWQAKQHSENKSKRVYASIASHYSIAKACRILDLDFHAIAVNTDGKMDLAQLQQQCQQSPPLAIVATAGTTGFGAIDDIRQTQIIAKQYECWLHVDACWGGALQFTDKADLLTGINEANSVSFDPHKALAQPKPSSLVLYQDAINKQNDIAYLSQTPLDVVTGSYGGELFLPLWCSINLIGKSQIIEQINMRLAQADHFAKLLAQFGDWQVAKSNTGIVCFLPSKRDADLSPLIKQGVLSQLNFAGQSWCRVVFASHLTTAESLFTRVEQALT